jgi:ribose transport system permease protein
MRKNFFKLNNGAWTKNPALVFLKNKSGILIGLVVLCFLISLRSDKFLTMDNIINVLRQISMNAIIATGMTMAIIINGIDLSVGSVIGMCGVFICGMIESNIAIPAAVLITLLMGAGVGAVNGIFIAKAKLPPFIVTLSTMTIVRGVGYIYSEGKPIRCIKPGFNFIGNGYIGIIPVPVVIMAAIMVFAIILLGKTKFGRHIYGIGGNREAAQYSGVNVSMVEAIVYIIGGMFAALSGIILAARLYSGVPTSGSGAEMDAIAATVLGGTSFSGGVGTISGTIVGALIIGVLSNGMNLLVIPYYYQLIIKGVVILAAVYADSVRKK